MDILHLAAECYPAAKVGGLADVAGSLPRYQRKEGIAASVLIPGYGTPWLRESGREVVWSGTVANLYDCRIERITGAELGFDLYAAEIPELFGGGEIYGGATSHGGNRTGEAERFIAFQRAALRWIEGRKASFDIVHCHDHHAGLVPFMMTRCPLFDALASVPTVLTVHNAEYQGRYDWGKVALLPAFPPEESGLLEWGDSLNSLAAGLKCCWRITTVSPTYLRELRRRGSGLERLFVQEKRKSTGILNGIDTREWDPSRDPGIHRTYGSADAAEGKRANREYLCWQILEGSLEPSEDAGPLFSFIGRLVPGKGADLLPDLIADFMVREANARFLVLGTGNEELEERFRSMREWYGAGRSRRFAAVLAYDERLAHLIYAASDFLIMPSRVEPCGLNQLYSMRYGTIPVVRDTGGLSDTVRDLKEPGGYGITFGEFALEPAVKAVERALALHRQNARMEQLRREVMAKDFSWNASARSYITLYNELLKP